MSTKSTDKIDFTTLHPYFNTIIVRQDSVEDKHGSIILPDSAVEADKYAVMTGTVVRLGELAFSFGQPGSDEFWRDPERPREGDRVMFRKYGGGQVIEGADGNEYRLIEQHDIVGKIND